MKGRTIGLIALVVVLAVVGCVALIAFPGTSTETNADIGDDPFFPPIQDDGISDADLTATAAFLSDQPGPSAIETASIYIALQDLPRGLILTDDLISDTNPSPAVGLREWPIGFVDLPANSISDIEQIRNQIVRTDIPRESPILSTQLVRDMASIRDNVGSDAALLLPDGLVAITLPLDLSGVGSVAFGLQHGDYVDVIFSFLFIEVDEQFQTRQPNEISIITRDPETGLLSFSTPRQGRPEPSTLSQLGVLVIPQETQRPRLVTQRTVTNAYVLHVGYFPPDGNIVGVMSPTPFDTPTVDPNAAEGQQQATPLPTATPFEPFVVTLGVEPQDALVLVWAVDSRIPITLALRAAGDQGTPTTTAVTLQYIIQTYDIPEPPILPFALEPAIRSLRQFNIESFTEFAVEEVSPEGDGG